MAAASVPVPLPPVYYKSTDARERFTEYEVIRQAHWRRRALSGRRRSRRQAIAAVPPNPTQPNPTRPDQTASPNRHALDSFRTRRAAGLPGDDARGGGGTESGGQVEQGVPQLRRCGPRRGRRRGGGAARAWPGRVVGHRRHRLRRSLARDAGDGTRRVLRLRAAGRGARRAALGAGRGGRGARPPLRRRRAAADLPRPAGRGWPRGAAAVPRRLPGGAASAPGFRRLRIAGRGHPRGRRGTRRGRAAVRSGGVPVPGAGRLRPAHGGFLLRPPARDAGPAGPARAAPRRHVPALAARARRQRLGQVLAGQGRPGAGRRGRLAG